MNDDKPIGPLRMICLVCGQEIGRVPKWGHGTYARTNAARGVFIYREGQPIGPGHLHPTCSDGAMYLDLTGKPDYSGYDPNGANPAYPDGYDATKRGQAADAALREETARLRAKKQAA